MSGMPGRTGGLGFCVFGLLEKGFASTTDSGMECRMSHLQTGWHCLDRAWIRSCAGMLQPE